MAVNGLGHQVCGGRTDDHKVCRAGQLDMAHLGFVGQAEEFGIDFFARERGDGKRRDKLRARLREDDARANTAPAELPDQLKAFIGSNAAADDEKDVFGAHMSAISGLIFAIPSAKTLLGPHQIPANAQAASTFRQGLPWFSGRG